MFRRTPDRVSSIHLPPFRGDPNGTGNNLRRKISKPPFTTSASNSEKARTGAVIDIIYKHALCVLCPTYHITTSKRSPRLATHGCINSQRRMSYSTSQTNFYPRSEGAVHRNNNEHSLNKLSLSPIHIAVRCVGACKRALVCRVWLARYTPHTGVNV